MKLEDMKKQKNEWQQQFETLSGNSPIIRNARKILKANIEKIDMMIFKAEAPEQFENYRNTLQGYIEHTHIF